MRRIFLALGLLASALLPVSHAQASETLIFNNSNTCYGWGPGTSTWAYRMYAATTATITALEVPSQNSTGASTTRLAIYSSSGGAPGTNLGNFTYSSYVSNTARYVGSATVPVGDFYWVFYGPSSPNPCSAGQTANSTGSGWTMSQYRYSGSNGGGPFTYDPVGTSAAMLQLKIYVGSVDSTAPSFTSPTSSSVAENQTSIGTMRVSESSTITLFGGSDISKFSLASIDSTSAALSFSSIPNFENPTDSDSNNSYQVVLRAEDSAGNFGYETFTATVFDVDENARILSYTTSGTQSKGSVVTIGVTVNFAGKVTFFANGKRIPTCISKPTIGSSPITVSCSWKPSTSGTIGLTMRVVPTEINYFASTSAPIFLKVERRGGIR